MRVVHSNPPTLLRVLVAALLVMIGTGFVAAPLGARAPAAQAPATLVDEGTTFFDVGLDNADVAFDDSITAARKCGFCMG
mmetsp:Transcript_29407/g.91007  ORF Transcript_29407/g.91007 Transcript_29407/m.91007 type:complete len:80 (+) Transcript_29407:528-767(+)